MSVMFRDSMDRHFFLYAKGHYKKTETVKDLSMIICERNGLVPQVLPVDIILEILLELALEVVSEKDPFGYGDGPYRKFCMELVQGMSYWTPDFLWSLREKGAEYVAITVCLVYLLNTSRLDIDSNCPLGEADPSVLPLNKNYEEIEED